MDVSIWGRVCVQTFLGVTQGSSWMEVITLVSIQVKLLFVILLFASIYFTYALIGPNIKYWENLQVISKAI